MLALILLHIRSSAHHYHRESEVLAERESAELGSKLTELSSRAQGLGQEVRARRGGLAEVRAELQDLAVEVRAADPPLPPQGHADSGTDRNRALPWPPAM